MSWLNSPSGDPSIGREMQRFYKNYRRTGDITDPSAIASAYGLFCWDADKRRPRHFKPRRGLCDLGLGILPRMFTDITKRALLVSDTLMLSDSSSGKYHRIASRTQSTKPGFKPEMPHHDYRDLRMEDSSLLSIADETALLYRHLHGQAYVPTGFDPTNQSDPQEIVSEDLMKCADIVALGRWLIRAEPLIANGQVYYEPRYTQRRTVRNSYRGDLLSDDFHDFPASEVDYLIRDRRAIDASGATPVKSRFIKPILRIDLPFIDGVSLAEFSKITVGEFDSYKAFRNYLRSRLIEIDSKIENDDGDFQLARIGLEIEAGIMSVKAALEKNRTKHLMTATGAVVGGISAVLVAVAGPALAGAVAALGASSGGIWALVQAQVENYSLKRAEQYRPWYYIWILEDRQ